jgi:predicted nucleotidyltransferase
MAPSLIMSTPDQVLATLREQHALLSRRYPIRRLALFGSWARGDARVDSDVDVLVDVDPSIGLRFVDLGDELEKALGRRVDLVSRRAIKPSLWKQIEPELIDAKIWHSSNTGRRSSSSCRTGAQAPSATWRADL